MKQEPNAAAAKSVNITFNSLGLIYLRNGRYCLQRLVAAGAIIKIADGRSVTVTGQSPGTNRNVFLNMRPIIPTLDIALIAFLLGLLLAMAA